MAVRWPHCDCSWARVALRIIDTRDAATNDTALTHCGFFGQRLAHFEASEFRMLEIERTGRLIVGTRMGGAELLQLGPTLERRLALPDGVVA